MPQLLLFAWALGACGSEPVDSGEPSASWVPAFDTTTSGSLSGVWGTGPQDVFVVGGGDAGGEVHHFDGSAWAPMSLPADTNLLVWSYGFSSSDVIAVGLGGAVVHWDGTTWTALDSGTTDDLWGVWGSGPGDVWIVGGSIDDGEPTLLHYDGSAFTAHVLDPAQNSRGAKALFKVWGLDGTVFAVGQDGLMITWDGSAWVEQGAGAQADRDFVSLWGTSSDHMVAVGGRANARVATWDGAAWDTLAPSGIGGLNAVYMEEPGTAYVGGVAGYVGTFDVDSQTLTAEVPSDTLDVHAMWGDGAGTVYAVGGTFLDGSHRGSAMMRVVE